MGTYLSPDGLGVRYGVGSGSSDGMRGRNFYRDYSGEISTEMATARLP